MNDTATAKSPERIEFLTDILITAVEGGIGYWSLAEGYRVDPVRWPYAERGVTLYIPAHEVDASDYRLPIGHGLIDSWNEEIPAYTVRVDLDAIAAGIGLITRGETGVHKDYIGDIFTASMTNDSGDLDANAADLIVQAAVFGKVIFG
jgi:hypothetical protein